MDTPIQPNDIAIILRPEHKEGEDWNGNFEIIISGFGPVTMSEQDIRELISMAMLVATIVPMMEQDAKLTERVMMECAKYYGKADNITIMDADDDIADDGYVLTADSKTVGGVQ